MCRASAGIRTRFLQHRACTCWATLNIKNGSSSVIGNRRAVACSFKNGNIYGFFNQVAIIIVIKNDNNNNNTFFAQFTTQNKFFKAVLQFQSNLLFAHKIKNMVLKISDERVMPTISKNNWHPFSNSRGYSNRQVRNNLSFSPKISQSPFYMQTMRRASEISALLKLPFSCCSSRQSLLYISYILWWCPMGFGKLNRSAFLHAHSVPSHCDMLDEKWQ